MKADVTVNTKDLYKVGGSAAVWEDRDGLHLFTAALIVAEPWDL